VGAGGKIFGGVGKSALIRQLIQHAFFHDCDPIIGALLACFELLP
jgi:GTPase SAR1 family protein